MSQRHRHGVVVAPATHTKQMEGHQYVLSKHKHYSSDDGREGSSPSGQCQQQFSRTFPGFCPSFIPSGFSSSTVNSLAALATSARRPRAIDAAFPPDKALPARRPCRAPRALLRTDEAMIDDDDDDDDAAAIPPSVCVCVRVCRTYRVNTSADASLSLFLLLVPGESTVNQHDDVVARPSSLCVSVNPIRFFLYPHNSKTTTLECFTGKTINIHCIFLVELKIVNLL